MAVVKASYIKVKPNAKGVDFKSKASIVKAAKTYAKGSIRYIQHRRGMDGERLTRPLFGSDGPMERHEAYRMINEAEEGSIFFRFILAPDPFVEDTEKDLSMGEIAVSTMQALDARVHRPVSWVAAVHDDHTDKRHIHVLAVVPQRLHVPDFEHMRNEATQVCLEQRQELDFYIKQRELEREEAQWGIEL